MDLRSIITENLTQPTMDKIAAAPKPTPTAEVVAVVKEFEVGLNLNEIAEILNISNPGGRRASAKDFDVEALRQHPQLRVIRSLDDITVKYER